MRDTVNDLKQFLDTALTPAQIKEKAQEYVGTVIDNEHPDSENWRTAVMYFTEWLTKTK